MSQVPQHEFLFGLLDKMSHGVAPPDPAPQHGVQLGIALRSREGLAPLGFELPRPGRGLSLLHQPGASSPSVGFLGSSAVSMCCLLIRLPCLSRNTGSAPLPVREGSIAAILSSSSSLVFLNSSRNSIAVSNLAKLLLASIEPSRARRRGGGGEATLLASSSGSRDERRFVGEPKGPSHLGDSRGGEGSSPAPLRGGVSRCRRRRCLCLGGEGLVTPEEEGSLGRASTSSPTIPVRNPREARWMIPLHGGASDRGIGSGRRGRRLQRSWQLA
ncbi:hypothetical protein SEVIR_1G080401v4 [Setaria viridis]